MSKPDPIQFVDDLGEAFEQVALRQIEEVSSTGRVSRRPSRYWMAGGAGLILLGAVFVFGVRTFDRPEDAAVQTRAFLAALAPTSSDYNPATGPDQLAEWSEVVVLGQIVGISEGRAFAHLNQIYRRTAVLHVSVESVLAGALPDPSRRMIHIELDVDNSTSFQELQASLPKRINVLVYASRAGDRPDVIEEGRGVPPGEPLMMAFSPQGFLIGVGSAVLSVHTQWPYVAEYVGIGLDEFAPPRDRWPVHHQP